MRRGEVVPMTDIGLTNDLNTNANVDNEHLSGDAGAAHGGDLHASQDGASYDGSAGGDVSYVSEHAGGSAGADATVSADTSGDVSVEPQLEGVPELPVEAPELPDTSGLEGGVDGALSATGDVTVGGDGASVAGGFEGWLDAMGDIMMEFAASVGAMVGL